MNTIANMRTAGGDGIGARQARMARNGQDAVVTSPGDGIAIGIVADGCGSGARAEIGSQLGAALFARTLRLCLERGASVLEAATWARVRAEVVAAIAALIKQLGGAEALREQFLFTIVAAAVTPEGAAVWA